MCALLAFAAATLVLARSIAQDLGWNAWSVRAVSVVAMGIGLVLLCGRFGAIAGLNGVLVVGVLGGLYVRHDMQQERAAGSQVAEPRDRIVR